MDTACPPSSGCYCQPRTGVEISHPTRVTRFVANEADPGWPDHIGNQGYAAHLAARESQHGCTQSRNVNRYGSDSASNTTTSSLSAMSRSSTPSPRQRSDSLLPDEDDTVPSNQPQSAPQIQIVDGSPEVLAEMRMLEMMEGLHVQETSVVSEEEMLAASFQEMSVASPQEERKERRAMKKGENGERRRKKKKMDLRKLSLKLWQQK